MNTNQPLLILGLALKASKNGIFYYNYLFKRNEVNAIYRSCPIVSLESFRCAIEFLDVYAASIAAPYKIKIIEKIDSLTEVSKITKSVNCIKRIDNKIQGHNTDALGLINIFKEQIETFEKNPSFLIYGTGGVVPSIVYALNVVFNKPLIYISGRNNLKVNKISKELNLNIITNPSDISVSLWINATPVSINNPEKILEISSNSSAVFDLNPIQEQYEFELQIKERNQKFIRGFDFYIEQFIEQYLFFVGKKITKNQIKGIINEYK